MYSKTKIRNNTDSISIYCIEKRTYNSLYIEVEANMKVFMCDLNNSRELACLFAAERLIQRSGVL